MEEIYLLKKMIRINIKLNLKWKKKDGLEEINIKGKDIYLINKMRKFIKLKESGLNHYKL